MCNRHRVVRCPIHRGHLDLTKVDRTWDPRAGPPVIGPGRGCDPVCRLMA